MWVDLVFEEDLYGYNRAFDLDLLISGEILRRWKQRCNFYVL